MERRGGQLSFAEALATGASRPGRLDRLDGLVDWQRFEALLAGLRAEGGRPGYPVLAMLKLLILQNMYGLSDAEAEEALGDRLSFRRFCGLGLADAVPDHTTICRFRLRLTEEGLIAPLFAELDRQIEAAGLILKRGTLIDATLIDAAAARPGPGAPGSDPDAAFVRLGRGGSRYGYKAHVGVDEGSGLVRAIVTTPANVPDTVPADQLVRGDEQAVLGDGAYHTRARATALRARGIKPRLMLRPNRHHPTLGPRAKHYNRLIGRRRAAVETTFATWKRRMGLSAIRYRGLAKASAQMLLVAIAFNLRRWTALAT